MNANLDRTVKLIGIAGPTGSGKSTLTRLIAAENSDVLRIKLDNYSFAAKGFPNPDADGNSNWNIPLKLNFNLLFQNLADLKAGKTTEIPVIAPMGKSFEIRYEAINPKPIILVEGFLLFFDEKVRDIFDAKIYMDIPDSAVLERRSLPGDSARIEFIKKVVIPNFKAYGYPAINQADLVLDGMRETEDLKKEVCEFCGI